MLISEPSRSMPAYGGAPKRGFLDSVVIPGPAGSPVVIVSEQIPPSLGNIGVIRLHISGTSSDEWKTIDVTLEPMIKSTLKTEGERVKIPPVPEGGGEIVATFTKERLVFSFAGVFFGIDYSLEHFSIMDCLWVYDLSKRSLRTISPPRPYTRFAGFTADSDAIYALLYPTSKNVERAEKSGSVTTTEVVALSFNGDIIRRRRFRMDLLKSVLPHNMDFYTPMAQTGKKLYILELPGIRTKRLKPGLLHKQEPRKVYQSKPGILYQLDKKTLRKTGEMVLHSEIIGAAICSTNGSLYLHLAKEGDSRTSYLYLIDEKLRLVAENVVSDPVIAGAEEFYCDGEKVMVIPSEWANSVHDMFYGYTKRLGKWKRGGM